MRRVLQRGEYRRLLAAGFVNPVASSVAAVALSLLVYRKTGSAIGATAFFLCAEFGPAFFSPWLVARLDQRSTRASVVALYMLEAIVFLVLAWIAGRFVLAAVLALTLLYGVLALTARVLTRTAWATMTSEGGLLREGQAASNMASSVAYMAGPALGGLLVAVSSTRTALLANAATFTALGLLIATTQGLPGAAKAPASTRGRLRAGLRYAYGEPALRRLLSLQALGWIFFTMSVPIEVVFVRKSLHGGAGGYGALLSTWGAGAIVGSAMYVRWRGAPARRWIVLGTVALGLGFTVMAAAPSLIVACVGAAIAGIGNGSQLVAVRTALQEATPRSWLALIVSINESLIQALPGIGFVLGGGIAAISGPRVALAVGAAGSLAIAVAMRLRLPPGLSGARRATPTEDGDEIFSAVAGVPPTPPLPGTAERAL